MVVAKKSSKPKVEKPKIEYKCTHCGEVYTNQEKEFYISHSILNIANNNRMTVCKNSVVEIYNELLKKYNDERAIYELCKLLDVCFHMNTFSGAKKQSEEQGRNLASTYLTKMNSLGNKNETGLVFADSDKFFEIIEQDDDEIIYSETEDFEITQEIIDFWGKGFNKQEIRFLEDFYESYIKIYEHDTPVQVNIYKNIAKTQLQANKELESGNVANYEKLMRTISTLHNDGNIKPVQETGANANDQVSFGMLVKKLENERPVDDPLDEWKDPDKFEKWQKIFIGHLADMNDIDNDVVKQYKEIIKPYTVSHEDENGE